MKSRGANGVVDLWEAWIDSGLSDSRVLYVVGNVSTGTSRTIPVLLKKKVQGAAPTHLILEVMPVLDAGGSRQAEVHYAEPVKEVSQYRQISICAGENIIARIRNIEVLY